MALDSENKRGSAMLLTLPYRPWLAEPDGTLDSADRVSLLKLCSAVTPTSSATLTTRHRYGIGSRTRVFVVPE